jgi:hypothetical protein
MATAVVAIDRTTSRRVSGIISHLGTRKPMDNGALAKAAVDETRIWDVCFAPKADMLSVGVGVR